jgi:modulator of FtsH protease HflK
MNHDHDHPHPHEPGHRHAEPPDPSAEAVPLALPVDAGSQALEEALRSSFFIVKLAMVVMVLVFLGSGFFTVGPQEKAVILRFGRPVGEGQKALLTAGLHWSFPYPIDEVVKIPITESQVIASTVGWYFTTPEQELSGEELPPGPGLNPAIDGYLITADRNIIHSRATIHYHIVDPLHYVFDFTNAAGAVQNALNNALVSTAARFNVDAIYPDNPAFQDAVLQKFSDLADQENLGISLEFGDVRSIPPRQLTAVFTQVTTARENRNKLLDDARSYQNKVLSDSTAQSVSITNLAATDRDNYVKSLKAEAKRYTDLLPQFEKYPNLFAQQQLVLAMAQILTNVQDKMFLPQREDGKPRQIRLMLNREPPQKKTGSTGQ